MSPGLAFRLLPAGQRLKTLTPANTIVIASSISNGGGSAIAAAELDTQGLISGVAVSEPAIEMPANPGVTVRRGSAEVAVTGKTLVDFTTYANLYQACASLAPSVSTSPYAAAFAAGFGQLGKGLGELATAAFQPRDHAVADQHADVATGTCLAQPDLQSRLRRLWLQALRQQKSFIQGQSRAYRIKPLRR